MKNKSRSRRQSIVTFESPSRTVGEMPLETGKQFPVEVGQSQSANGRLLANKIQQREKIIHISLCEQKREGRPKLTLDIAIFTVAVQITAKKRGLIAL